MPFKQRRNKEETKQLTESRHDKSYADLSCVNEAPFLFTQKEVNFRIHNHNSLS